MVTFRNGYSATNSRILAKQHVDKDQYLPYFRNSRNHYPLGDTYCLNKNKINYFTPNKITMLLIHKRLVRVKENKRTFVWRMGNKNNSIQKDRRWLAFDFLSIAGGRQEKRKTKEGRSTRKETIRMELTVSSS